MGRTAAVVLLSLAAASGAQAQTSKPTSKPAKPARTLLAEALVNARQNKRLGPILKAKTFSAPMGADYLLFHSSGTADDRGISLKFGYELVGQGQQATITYRFGSDGAIKEVTGEQTKGSNKRSFQVTINGTKATHVITRRGKALPPAEALFGVDALPMMILLFVLPSLYDQGIPASLWCRAVQDESIGRWDSEKAKQFQVTRTKTPVASKALKVHRFTMNQITKGLGRFNLTYTATVSAEGKTQGQILGLTMKQGKQPALPLAPISQAQVAELRKSKPLLENEAAAARMLMSVRWAQDAHKRDKGEFADSLDGLGQQRRYDLAAIKDGQYKGYSFMVRRAPDAPGKKWMAIAIPIEPGKTGKRYFVLNHEGKLHASPKPLQLNDTCAIPKGAKKLAGF